MRAHLKPGQHIVLSVPSHPPQYSLFHKEGVRVREVTEGTPYIELTDRQEETGFIPEKIHQVVECYSLNLGHYGGGAKTSREIGRYRLDEAHATVSRNGEGYHSIHIRGTDAGDVVELGRRIVAGTIAPFKSHERGQVKAGLPGFKDALHQLIEAAFRAFDRWRFA